MHSWNNFDIAEDNSITIDKHVLSHHCHWPDFSKTSFGAEFVVQRLANNCT